MDPRHPWVALSALRRRLPLTAALAEHGGVERLLHNGFGDGPLADLPAAADALADEADAALALCARLGVDVLPLPHPDYPDALRALPDPPPALFLVGDRRRLTLPRVALVGSRRGTEYGRWAARTLARSLSRAGICVVSGMALGVDAAAHQGALEGEGGTIAVLGGSPERATPSRLAPLYQRIADEQLVVSEFPPETTPRARNYPMRNRVVAGLSRAVVVVEAARHSGALITADMAARQQRRVLAVPGPIDSVSSAGSNRLLKGTAEVVLGTADLLASLGLDRPRSGDGEPPPGVDDDGAAVLRALAGHAAAIDELVERTGFPLPRLRTALLRLRLRGVVQRAGGDRYAPTR